MIKKHTFLITLFSCLSIYHTAFSSSYECGDSIKEIGSYLELDKNQTSKIDPMLKGLKKITQDRALKIRKLNNEINKQTTSEFMNENNIDVLVDKKAKLISEVIKLKVKTNHKIYILLKRNQKIRYQKLMQNCHDKMAFD